MNRGGIESWLMNVLRRIHREQFQVDFLVHTQEKCAFDEELLSMGCRIIAGADPHKPLRYALRFQRILKEYGPYDIVHSHVYSYSGYVLFLAFLFGAPIRIAHTHTNRSIVRERLSIGRRFYTAVMRALLKISSTHRLAISRQSAADLYGNEWSTDPRCSILHYGIDLTPFQKPTDRTTARRQLRIDDDAFVIGHVGRMVQVKNHRFLVQVAKSVQQLIPNFLVLLVGEGPLRSTIERTIATEGLSQHFIFVGERSDVPNLLTAMDVFLFPSIYEGFGLAILEAQAAGLPCLVSDAIPEEVIVLPSGVRRKNLRESSEAWAADIVQLWRNRDPRKGDSLSAIQQASYDINASVLRLESLYRQAVTERSRKAFP